MRWLRRLEPVPKDVRTMLNPLCSVNKAIIPRSAENAHSSRGHAQEVELGLVRHFFRLLLPYDGIQS